MASYKLIFRQSVAKDLRRIPKPDVAWILSRIEALQDEPRPPRGEKLSGQERYRVRQGVYRIPHEVADDARALTVVKSGIASRFAKRASRPADRLLMKR